MSKESRESRSEKRKRIEKVIKLKVSRASDLYAAGKPINEIQDAIREEFGSGLGGKALNEVKGRGAAAGPKVTFREPLERIVILKEVKPVTARKWNRQMEQGKKDLKEAEENREMMKSILLQVWGDFATDERKIYESKKISRRKAIFALKKLERAGLVSHDEKKWEMDEGLNQDRATKDKVIAEFERKFPSREGN